MSRPEDAKKCVGFPMSLKKYKGEQTNTSEREKKNVVHYEETKRDLKRILIYEGRRKKNKMSSTYFF
jgi:hypothetical protein